MESIAFTQIWNAFPKGVARFHPGPEHKKDILDLRHKERVTLGNSARRMGWGREE